MIELPQITSEDRADIIAGKVVVYACLERNGFLTMARTALDKQNFLNTEHTQQMGGTILGELQQALYHNNKEAL